MAATLTNMTEFEKCKEDCDRVAKGKPARFGIYNFWKNTKINNAPLPYKKELLTHFKINHPGDSSLMAEENVMSNIFIGANISPQALYEAVTVLENITWIMRVANALHQLEEDAHAGNEARDCLRDACEFHDDGKPVFIDPSIDSYFDSISVSSAARRYLKKEGLVDLESFVCVTKGDLVRAGIPRITVRLIYNKIIDARKAMEESNARIVTIDAKYGSDSSSRIHQPM